MFSSNKSDLYIISGVCIALAMASACAPQKTVRRSNADELETSTSTAKNENSVESGEANLRGSEFQSVSDLQASHFAYDAYALDETARTVLKTNAEYLKAHPNLEILVAGYCDERGTTAYNLALGQRRAKAVREFYVHLGIPGKSLATISYGKEKPICSEHTDDCWTQNRRAETTVRLRAGAAADSGAGSQ